MPLYRQMLLTAADAPVATVLRKLALDITQRGGVMRHVQNHGLQRMAYPLYDRKSRAGVRHDLVRMAFSYFDAPTSAVQPIEEVMLYDEAVLRISTTRAPSRVDDVRRRSKRERMLLRHRQEVEGIVRAGMGEAKWDAAVEPNEDGTVYDGHSVEDMHAFHRLLDADRQAHLSIQDHGDNDEAEAPVPPALKFAYGKENDEVLRQCREYLAEHGTLPWYDEDAEAAASLTEAQRAHQAADEARLNRNDPASRRIVEDAVPSAEAVRAVYDGIPNMLSYSEFKDLLPEEEDAEVESAVDDEAEFDLAIQASRQLLSGVESDPQEVLRHVKRMNAEEGVDEERLLARLMGEEPPVPEVEPGTVGEHLASLQDAVFEAVAKVDTPIKTYNRANDPEFQAVVKELGRLEGRDPRTKK